MGKSVRVRFRFLRKQLINYYLSYGDLFKPFVLRNERILSIRIGINDFNASLLKIQWL